MRYEGWNPPSKPCWETCGACFRCEHKGEHSWCRVCSGRDESEGPKRVDDWDRCRCKEGVLQWRTKAGRLIVAPYPNNPFKHGSIKFVGQSEDERDWNSYLNDMRERFDDPTWDPIKTYIQRNK